MVLVVLVMTAPAVVSSPVGGTVRAHAEELSVTRLQRDIAENSRRIDELGREIDDAGRRERSLTAEIGATEVHLERTRAEADALRAELRRRAAVLYVVGRSRRDPLVELRRPSDAVAARRYGDGIAQADQALVLRLGSMAEDLDAEVARLRAAREAVQEQRTRAVAARAALEELLARQRRLLAALDVIPVMGKAQLTARQIGEWFDSTGMPYRLAGGMSIRDLAQVFLEEGAAEEVRGDVAFAQAVLETGYFRWALDNNYAGLGACDSCAGQPGFPTPRDGVRAQIQHLKNYADPDSVSTGLAYPPSPTWYGADPAQAARNFDSFYAKGRAQTWQAMGRGNWATDPNYAAKVIGVYVRMVVFAYDRG